MPRLQEVAAPAAALRPGMASRLGGLLAGPRAAVPTPSRAEARPPPPEPAPKSLAQDEMEIVILRASLPSLGVALPNSFASFRILLPNASMKEGTTATVIKDPEPVYNSSFVLKYDRRRQATVTAFSNRKLVVEITWVPHTGVRRFFSPSPMVVGRADVKLAPLLTQTELRADAVPLRSPTGAQSPGHVSVALRVKLPVAAAADTATPGTRARGARGPAPRSTAHAAPQQVPRATAAPPLPMEDDFTFAARIDSFDVVVWELAQLDAGEGIYKHVPSLRSDDRRFALSMRKDLIELQVASGKLTLSSYLDALRKKIAAEEVRATQLKSSAAQGAIFFAVHALKRAKIMRDELQGAEKDLAQAQEPVAHPESDPSRRAPAPEPPAEKPTAAPEKVGDPEGEEEEEEDEFSFAARIESFDVLTWEIEQVNAGQGVHKRLSPNGKQDRLFALGMRKDLIEGQVASGQISLPAYLDTLRKAISQEQRVAMACKARGRPQDVQQGIHALKRVKIMHAELQGALANQSAEGAPGA